MASSALAVDLDPALSEYRPAGGVSGNIKTVGSDTLNNLMALWSEAFKGIYPDVKFSI